MSRLLHSLFSVLLILGLAVTLTSLSLAKPPKISAQAESPTGQAIDDTALLDGFRHVEVASVSDAIEQIAGKRMYMAHSMAPDILCALRGFCDYGLFAERGESRPRCFERHAPGH
jgi:hypothetical protein